MVTDSRLPDDDVQSLFEDGRGRVWVTTARGVAFFGNGRFTPVDIVPEGTNNAIVEDGAGNLWITNPNHGLIHLLGGTVVEETPWARLGHQGYSLTLLRDPMQGGLWLGFVKGGVGYFRDGQVRASYTSADGLGNGRVNDLRFESGVVWAATEGGLSRIKDRHVTTLTSKNGLPCDTVHWSIEDEDHSVWLYMPCGLVRIGRSELDSWLANPKRTIQVTIFDSSDGVRSYSKISAESPLAYAQQAAPERKVSADQVADDTIQLMRQDIRCERKKIVAANLPLTEDEAVKF